MNHASTCNIAFTVNHALHVTLRSQQVGSQCKCETHLHTSHIRSRVQAIFPKAKLVSSTWDRFVAALAPSDIDTLPRYSSEWADQWIAGLSADPKRLASYRATIRARASCIASKACLPHEPVLRNFTRFVAKNVEHTQGVQGDGGQVSERASKPHHSLP